MKTAFIFLLIFLLYLFRLLSLPKLNLKDGQMVKVTGTLAQEPEISGNKQSFHLGSFEVWTEKYPEYHYGDKVELVGQVKEIKHGIQNPLASSNPPLKSFNSYLLSYPEIKSTTLLRPAKGGTSEGQAGVTHSTSSGQASITGVAANFKKRLLSFYQRALPAPFDGILSGIVLGDKSLISFDLFNKFKASGTLHIMVASGMNVAFIAGSSLSILCLFFKRRQAIIFLILLIYFYCLMTGLSASVVRAGIMVGLFYLSQLSGREINRGRILLLTGLVMVLAEPRLLFDVGFQLSFLATAGLVFLQPIIQNNQLPSTKFQTRRNIFGILLRSSNFSSTLAAQIFTLPVLIGSFGQVNLLSPLTNLLILWAVPFILQIGIVAGILGLLVEQIGKMALFLVFPLLYYINQIVFLSAKITIGQVFLPKIGLILSLLYYLVIGLIIVQSSKCKV